MFIIKRAYTRLRVTKIGHKNNNDDDDDFIRKCVFILFVKFYVEICRLIKRIVNRQIARRKTIC